ncbi:hypothetical protein BC835DRAFT_1415475 [Cytidiella melzeri]|nr:hypothetical protein BC835DRAFT_1415475 [Cytidiella melzeri]
MSWSTSVLSSVSSDTEPTVVISFDSGKYVFNVGENTGRAWLSSKMYWRKTKGVFLTSVGTQRGSGLPGLLMFIADGGISNINLVGPRGLTHFLASMRSYLFRDTMLVKVTEVDTMSVPEPIFRDENLTVYGVPLSANTSCSAELEGLGSGGLETGKRKRALSPESPSKRTHIEADDAHSGNDLSVRERALQPGFSPTSLHGDEAQEWRRIAVDSMFPYSSRSVQAVASTQSKRQIKQDKDKNGASEKQMVVAPFDDASMSNDQPQTTFSYTPGLSHGSQHLPRFERGEFAETLCYVCVGPRVRGKFDARKAQALKIPKGPLLGKLANGNTITFMVDDGKGGQEQRTVQPEECVAPSEPPKVVIILDVPSQAHIASLSSAFDLSPLYRQLRSKSNDEYAVSTIYHLCGEGVIEDVRYKTFMNGFPASVHHVVASREHSADPVTFKTSLVNQLTLHQLDEGMFPIPQFHLKPRKTLADVPDLSSNTIVMTSNLYISVRPPQPPVSEEESTYGRNLYSACTSSTPIPLTLATADAFETAKEKLRTLQSSERVSRPGDDVVVTPLGTSSAAPSKARNVSSTLIQIPRWGNVLLDCGEGTWGQLVRLFGDDPRCSNGVWQALRELKCVYLSHIHGDHHIGLAKLLAMRRKLNPPPTEPLYVVGVYAILLYLRELADVEDLDLDREDGRGIVTILSDALNWRNPRPYGSDKMSEPWMDFKLAQSDATKMCQSLNLKNFITVDVRHRTRCYGVVLKHHDGWSIVYSADTMPCDNLVKVGMNATLLIHEATMADDQADLARQKAHSTCGQAIKIGHRMNAENIMLTHFSTRYPKLPPVALSDASPDTASTQPNLVLAFDHARIPLGEMYKFKTYLPAIEQCFSDIPDEDDIIQ